MRYDFIHAGLGKCMSTTLQRMWGQSTNVYLEGGKPIVKLANRLAPEHRGNLDAMPIFDLELQNRSAGAGIGKVLSHEGFSFSFVNHPQNADFMAAKHAYIAKGLKGTSSTVMFMVRNPVRWIRSCHAQSIHQGGHQNARDYLTHQRQVIVENLNLVRLFGIWREQGFRVAILPMELYIENPDQFWATYETLLNSPIPNDRTEPTGRLRNQSNPDTLPLAAEINRLQYKLSMLVERGEAPDKQKVFDSLDYVRRWGARRAFETATPQDLEALARSIPPKSKDEFHRHTLDDELLKLLAKIYVEPLRTFDTMAGWVDEYAESISTP